ncbi:MAG: hypothetical protein GPOALKHO_001275 [Sodalis sp.]|nr:MAG: hypothetical protein GPOALKHO_001275 [Sodalis sp.]
MPLFPIRVPPDQLFQLINFIFIDVQNPRRKSNPLFSNINRRNQSPRITDPLAHSLDQQTIGLR